MQYLQYTTVRETSGEGYITAHGIRRPRTGLSAITECHVMKCGCIHEGERNTRMR